MGLGPRWRCDLGEGAEPGTGRRSRPPHLPRSHTLTPAPFPPGHAQLVCKSHGKALASGQSSPAPPRHTLCIHVPLCTAFTVLRGGWTVDSQGSGLRLCLRILHPATTERNRPLVALACTGPWASRHGLQQLCPVPHVVVVPWQVPSLGARDRGSNSRCIIGIKYMAVSDFCPLCALDACPC